ncbi:carbohydrate sulfotransferase 5-like [Protopterus annectens]|uniref:carbohydrate sulfotransferase 5-like n=1 Tax=Protopterus annectens TaxID=7888 RepID=UPI001CFAEC22|nr:carbohydrate sulfotransferase 5-like [Protopterus annectens]
MARLTKLHYFIVLQALVTVAIIILMHNKNPSYYQKSRSLNKQTQILIISSWRSGSSLLGQLFNVNPNVFYLMEPGWHIWRHFQYSSANSLQMAVRDLLRSLFLCDITAFNSYIPSEDRNNLHLFGWGLSRALCSRPACNAFSRTYITSEDICTKACGTYPLNKIEEVCQTYSHIVLKEVRLCSLEPLYSLLNDPSLNLKIIHLVRDPRAVLNSRNKQTNALKVDSNILYRNILKKEYFKFFHSGDREYKLMEEICKYQVSMYKTATQEANSFIKDRYKMVRFEDLTKNPLEVLKDLYKFSNLTLSSELQTWVYSITHGNGDGGKNGSFQVSSRDAAYVSEAWKTSLSTVSIRTIERVCAEALRIFGYDHFTSDNN